MTALLQSNKNGVASGATSINIVFNSSSVTAGSLLVCYAGSTAANRTFTASDNINGSWNVDSVGTGGQSSTSILTFPNSASGSITVTLNISGAGAELDAIIEEWTGVQTVTPLDKTANNNSAVGVSTGNAGTTATLSQTNELCLAMLHTSSTAGAGFAPQSPFTPSPQSPNNGGAAILCAAGSLIQASTTAVSCTFNWTNSVTFRACTATYKTVQLGQLAPFYSRKYILFNT